MEQAMIKTQGGTDSFCDNMCKYILKSKTNSFFHLVAKITNQNARPYLEENLFPELRKVMKDLLHHIQSSGELNKYWNAVDKQNNDARKAAKKAYRETKRIEMASDYQSSEGERNEVEEVIPEETSDCSTS